MKKDEAEHGIRAMCRDWAQAKGLRAQRDEQPSFSEFYSWVQDNHPSYLDFRDSIGVRETVERWFDDEFRQSWRN